MLERVVDWSLLNGVGVALSKTQFKVLFSLLEARGPLTQRELSRSSGLGLGTVNAVVRLGVSRTVRSLKKVLGRLSLIVCATR